MICRLRCQMSGSMSATQPPPDHMALLCMMSSPPKRSTANATVASTSASTPTSQWWNAARAPLAATSATTASPASSLMSAHTTAAPSLAKRRSVAAPMPDAAPVMIATLPSNLCMDEALMWHSRRSSVVVKPRPYCDDRRRTTDDQLHSAKRPYYTVPPMPTMWQRDLEADRERLTAWLCRRLPEARDVRITDLVAPQSSGFSNETLLFVLECVENGRARRDPLVVRIEPKGMQVFPEYDLGLQFRTMRMLSATDVPVPPVHWIEEEDRSVLGGAFYVMGQVRGRVPTDQPPYHAGGWMTEVSPAERSAIWWGGIETLARIHRLDYRALGFSFLERPQLGATPLDWQIAYYERYLEWVARGRPQPIAEAAFEWIKRHKPVDEPT